MQINPVIIWGTLRIETSPTTATKVSDLHYISEINTALDLDVCEELNIF